MDKQNVICICGGILFSLLKEGDSTHATTWINLEDILLGERRQSQKDKYYVIPLN
jgi:hypothetical protein